ncbi:Aste57867_1310 [Aphanomyces stellatus]|uniref:protein O-GlcNAc transferase n=1 Tax=Aphanomyces stellatus TaxID=120398 RepID=A0A485KAB7_9STRA|nr:hypothetical protein As57867_001309 [Aphanomyces stellatus]VFT78529.1 Aste57867_1310 [Aphanomyces stellatus]
MNALHFAAAIFQFFRTELLALFCRPRSMGVMGLIDLFPILFAFVAATITIPSPSETTHLSIEDQFQRAVGIMNGGDAATAKQLWTRMRLISPTNVDVLVALGALAHLEGAAETAQRHYKSVLALDPTNDAAHGNLGMLYYTAQTYTRAMEHFRAAVAANPAKADELAHPIALTLHELDDDVSAIPFFERALRRLDHKAEVHYDFAVTLQDEGMVARANDEYNRAIALRPDYAEVGLVVCWLAMRIRTGGVAQHRVPPPRVRQCRLGDSQFQSMRRTLQLDALSPALALTATINFGVALEAAGEAVAALARFDQGHALVRLMGHAGAEKYALYEHTTRVRRAIALWRDYDDAIDEFVRLVVNDQLHRGTTAALMPFSSLLLAVSPQLKRWVAEAYVDGLVAPHATSATWSSAPPHRRLHVGYLSYDFNNHPTAHLMEGLFVCHNRTTFQVSALSYGKDDGSVYRQSIPQLAERFLDLVLLGTTAAAAAIKAAQVDILIDAQGHTLGQRHGIVALRPAPIIINYLVYPGTLGATYVDYLITDTHVSPPEHADHYTEALMLMPRSYQVNYFDASHALTTAIPPFEDHVARHRRHRSPFVFANFNKIDKLEPHVFAVWMAILRRVGLNVPTSELWLLEPKLAGTSDLIVAHLRAEASQHGVAPARLRFLPRVDKADHLRRQHHADLFLDTFVYGAHSTATDALAGNLPVLTLGGETFASRVGISLLANVGCRDFVAHTTKEFEDMAGISSCKCCARFVSLSP